MVAVTDIAVVVAEFAADPMRTSLELAHMTTGQRKSTKKMLEQYPDLKCESYGFGAERQLHLFKKQADLGSSPVCEEESSEAADRACDLPTTAPVLPSMDKQFQVRNTFIHFENSVDERAVQSMPHGMFKQSLLTEKQSLLTETSPEAMGYDTPSTGCNTPTSVSELDAELRTLPVDEGQDEKDLALVTGALVVVHGLVKVPEFNGKTAVVQGWDEETGRYNILLASSGNCQQAKIKEENLRVVCACP
jgi:hypothetical protein